MIKGLEPVGFTVMDPAVTDSTLGMDRSRRAWMAEPDGNRIEWHPYTPESWQTPPVS